MATKALTDKTIAALKPGIKRYEVHDLRCPGLTFRVECSGRKAFYVRFRYGLEQKHPKLGSYPRMSLATAREKANDWLRQVEEGIDPTKRKRSSDMKVQAVCGEFIRLHAQARNKSWREAERILEREFVGPFGQRDIREIKRFDVLEIMDAAVARGSTYQANRILSNIRKLFNWCVERGIVDTSPITGLKAPTKEESRDRVLEDDEIVRLLRASRNDVYPFRQFVPILLAPDRPMKAWLGYSPMRSRPQASPAAGLPMNVGCIARPCFALRAVSGPSGSTKQLVCLPPAELTREPA